MNKKTYNKENVEIIIGDKKIKWNDFKYDDYSCVHSNRITLEIQFKREMESYMSHSKFNMITSLYGKEMGLINCTSIQILKHGCVVDGIGPFYYEITGELYNCNYEEFEMFVRLLNKDIDNNLKGTN